MCETWQYDPLRGQNGPEYGCNRGFNFVLGSYMRLVHLRVATVACRQEPIKGIFRFRESQVPYLPLPPLPRLSVQLALPLPVWALDECWRRTVGCAGSMLARQRRWSPSVGH
jgi:hypothetical protein